MYKVLNTLSELWVIFIFSLLFSCYWRWVYVPNIWNDSTFTHHIQGSFFLQLNFVLAISGLWIPFFVELHFLITFFGLFRNSKFIMLRISERLEVAVWKIDKITSKKVIEEQHRQPESEEFKIIKIFFLLIL